MSCLKGNKKCPCRLWINCSVYVDEYEKARRLRSRDDTEIQVWFEDNFRAHLPVMSDFSANG